MTVKTDVNDLASVSQWYLWNNFVFRNAGCGHNSDPFLNELVR